MSIRETANDRFKRHAQGSFWPALIAATLLHAALFAASPVWAIDAGGDHEDPTEVVRLPEVRLPEPPPPLQRPVAPVIDASVDEPVWTPPTVPAPGGDARLAPPPPPSSSADEGPRFTPMDIAPRLLNDAEIQRALARHYPPALRDAGIGGEVVVWFHLDADGGVLETRLQRSSGFETMDAAALAVAERMRFSPAYNRDRRVPVWVVIPIRFETQR